MKTQIKKFTSLMLVIFIIMTFIPVETVSAITLSAESVLMVSAGNDHTLMIRNDGTLWAWGGNTNGRLGDGTTNNSAVPLQIGTNTNWIYVSAGGHHS
ncbi:MAG: hypothetical protein FWC90_07615, partial [Oscillospiraceae bacterium]|nr:hypothetical protein [Oscillospiraceae bacterium]